MPLTTRTVLWQRLDMPGLEYAMIQPADKGWLLQGDAITEIGGRPARMIYQVRVDAQWKTHRVAVDFLLGAARHRLHIVHHPRRGWRLRPMNSELVDLHGCVDVDLSISPATNILPIRRLAPQIGQSVSVTAAWIRFPEGEYDKLSIDPLAQTYTRLDERRYAYSSGPPEGEPTYHSEITVDEFGMVAHYAGGWRRMSQFDQPLTEE